MAPSGWGRSMRGRARPLIGHHQTIGKRPRNALPGRCSHVSEGERPYPAPGDTIATRPTRSTVPPTAVLLSRPKGGTPQVRERVYISPLSSSMVGKFPG